MHIPTLVLCLTRSQMARETIHWDRPFQTVRAGSFETGDIVWFPEGGLNASYNCVDRWAFKHPDKVRFSSFACYRTPEAHTTIAPLIHFLDCHHLRGRRA